MNRKFVFITSSIILIGLLIGVAFCQYRQSATFGTFTVNPSAEPLDLTNQNSPYAAVFLNGTSFTTLVTPDLPSVNIQLIAAGFVAPMQVISAKDGTGRLFVVDQIGDVYIILANGTRLAEPFLSVKDRMVPLNPFYDERGLLSLAFHPNFTNNGKLYVHYSAALSPEAPPDWNCAAHISEFSVSSTNPNTVNMSSERILMIINKPDFNHNGGPVVFGADGYLYVPIGDGGGADDAGMGHTGGTGNAQDLTKVLGKVLRIDVDHDNLYDGSTVTFTGSNVSGVRPYSIPAGNPFFGNASVLPEIYTYGHRNPAYASMYSNSSNVLFIAEAGQNLFEDVNMILNGGNYGWHLREGTHCFNVSAPNNPPSDGATVGSFGEPLIGPIFEGGHDLGAVVVGGEIYHGGALPAFRNKYVFGYFTFSPKLIGDNTIFVASPPANWSVSQLPSLAKDLQPSDIEMWSTESVTVDNALLMDATGIVRAISAGEDGELYVLANSVLGPNAATSTGTVYKIVPSYPLQTIESCDASGNVKNTFNLSDSVYVFGSGFPASSTFDIHVVADQGSWTALNGMPIPTPLATDIHSITSDSSGNIAVSLLWSQPSLGNYDIIVDVNRNGLYEIGIDAVDNDDVVTAGVVIIPEISQAAALCMIALPTVFVALKHKKPRKTQQINKSKD
jgi:glucose/arabinose dehydrogenase